VQVAVLGTWASLVHKLQKLGAVMLVCWAAVEFMPRSLWLWLSGSPHPVPWIFRSVIHLGEALNKAAGMLVVWGKAKAYFLCRESLSITAGMLLNALVFGCSRGAASTWVRCVDQYLRGGALRAKGLAGAFSEVQRYLLLTLFGFWCYLPFCMDSIGGREAWLPRVLLAFNPVRVTLEAMAQALCIEPSKDHGGHVLSQPEALCGTSSDRAAVVGEAVRLFCMAYLMALYMGKAHPSTSLRSHPIDRSTASRKQE